MVQQKQKKAEYVPIHERYEQVIHEAKEKKS